VREPAVTFGPDRALAAMAPDGSRIAYLSAPQRRDGRMSAELWTVAADGTDPILLHDFGCCFLDWSPPVWAPDGTEFAIYLHVHDGNLETSRVSVLDYPAGDRLRLIDGFGSLSWQPRPPEE
jgi:Tol biopolymer transport system component